MAIALFVLTCKSQEHFHPTLIKLSDHHNIIFLDSINASSAIVSDTIEHFFEQINRLDMSIQLKRKLNPSVERASLLEEYKADLKKEVLNFNPDEIIFIQSIFQDIYKECIAISKNIFPSEIKLIKVRGSHYGDGAFYTRENCIIIPQSDLKDPVSLSFRKTMLHELFHIYSRLNTEKKEKLYGLIGFKSTGGKQLLQIDNILKEKIVLNPDGINYAYSIKLKADDATTFNAIPLIISNEEDFNENKTAFFAYLQFGLYKIIPPFSKMIKVVSGPTGESIIDFKKQADFFEQITDNTDYIIHPDELMADNFVILVQSQNDPSELDKLSAPGKELVSKVLEILSD